MKTKSLIIKAIIIVICFLFQIKTVNAQWQQTGGPQGDYINFFYANGTDFFAGSYDNIYKSTDSGQNWNKINFITVYSSITSFATDGTRMYIGTYDAGIYRSVDNGVSWYPVNSGIQMDPQTSQYYPIYSLTIYNNKIYAGSYEGKIYYSSNYGAYWSSYITGMLNESVESILFNGSMIFAIGDNGGFLRSQDNGLTWDSLIFLQTGANNIISKGQSIYLTTGGEGIFYSSDNGTTWTTLNQNLPHQEYDTTYYKPVNAIAVDSSNIYISVSSYVAYSSNMTDEILVSSNNGQTWSVSNTGFNTSKAYSISTFNNKIFAGTYNGIYISDNNGSTWHCSNKGLIYNGVMSLAVDGDNIFAGTYHNGIILSTDNGASWTPFNHNMPEQPIVNDIKILGNKIFAGTDYWGAFYSSDYGSSWNPLSIGYYYAPENNIKSIGISDTSVFAITNSNFSGSSVYIGSINNLNFSEVVFPDTFTGAYSISVSGNTVYIGSMGKIYYSNDAGITWQKFVISAAANQIISDVLVKDNKIFVYVISDSYWSTSPNKIIMSADNGVTWNTVLSGFYAYYDTMNPSNYQMKQFNNSIFVATDGGLLVSPDNGINWVTMNNGTSGYFPMRLLGSDNNFLYTGYSGVWKRPLTDFNVINASGTVYSDDNNNGVMDAGELGLANILLSTKSNNYFTTNAVGKYALTTMIDNDTIRVISQSPYATVTPLIHVVVQSDTAVNFGVHLIPNIKDLQVTLTNLTAARPGFDVMYRATFKNVGTTVMNGNVKLIFDNNLTLLTCNPLQSSINSDTIIWDYVNLTPLESRDIDIKLNLLSTISIGTQLISVASIYPISGDTMPNNNTDNLAQITTGSYDPNEKEVKPADGLTQPELLNGDKLVYTIHFQNTGTDTAFNIKIIDTLDANLYIPSIEVLSASHPYTYRIKGSGIIEFIFSNILLLDSNNNEPQSHGYVKYAISPLNSLYIGSTISNTAYIYFDYNSPIVTNTTSTTILDPVNIGYNYSENDVITLYPNPAENEINIQTENNISTFKIEILNSMGQTLFFNKICKKTVIDVSNLSKGIYLMKFTSDKFNGIKKFIKQ